MYPLPVFFSPSVSSGGFILPLLRTSVRYNGYRCDCVRIVYPVRWRRSAPILRGIFFHGGEGRELLWGLPGGGRCSIYRRRFILLAAHSYPLLLPASPFPLFSFPICVPVRLTCRLASRLVVRLVSCVPLRRAVYRAVLLVRHVVSFRAVSFCCSLVLVLFVVA